jgi:hypothetical protein
LTTVILLGSVLVPAGLAVVRPLPVYEEGARATPQPLGAFPVPRRDVERLQQVLALQRRLIDPNMSPRARRALMHRSAFADALTWLEIHGEVPEIVAEWRAAQSQATPTEDGEHAGAPARRRRRRRRRRGPRFRTPIQ